MKSKIVVLMIAALLSVTTVYEAMAYGKKAETEGYHHGSKQGVNCPVTGKMDEATHAKIEKFFKDNRALHKSIIVTRAQLKAIMKGDNPDAAKVKDLTGELYDLRVSFQEKAKEAGVGRYVGHYGMGAYGCKFASGYHRSKAAMGYHHGKAGKGGDYHRKNSSDCPVAK